MALGISGFLDIPHFKIQSSFITHSIFWFFKTTYSPLSLAISQEEQKLMKERVHDSLSVVIDQFKVS